MANVELGGFLYTDAGVATANATVNVYTRNTTTPVLATTTTDANGWWAISYATQGRYDVEVVNGTSKRRRKYDTREQLEYLEVANFRVRNPADTFEYDIVPSAITAARQLNLPLITGTDTLMTLGLAQTVTGVLTLTTPAIGDATGTSLVLTGNLSAEDLLIEDSDASHYLTITTTSNLTAARTLTIVPGDASRTVTLSGDTTLSGTNTGDVTLGGTPNYITLANQVLTLTKLDPADDLNTFASSVLATLVTDETGSGALVFGTAPTIAGGTHTALTGLGIRSTGTGAFDLTLANAENLAAGRTLTIQLGDAARTLILGASPSLSGTNTGDQTITLTGDVTGSGTGSFAATIAAAAVTLAKMADIATARFIGRTTAATGVPESLTAAQATALLDAATATVKGLVPTPPNNTTTFLRGDATFAAPAGGGGLSTPMTVATIFETAARFTESITSGGSSTWGTAGMSLSTSGTGTSGIRELLSLGDATFSLFLGSPLFSQTFKLNTSGTDYNMFCGIGGVAAGGGTISYTFDHVGWKVTRAASGTISLFATQGDGTTENASGALLTVATATGYDLVLKVNSTTSTDYYTRTSGGALSAATNLTTNMPDTSIEYIAWSVTNSATASNTNFIWGSAHYER